MSVVATVATDGGENRLSLEPIQLQVVRVADSLGEIYFEDFIAQSLKPEEILRFFFQSNERLQRFSSYLKLDWSQLLPRSDFQRSQLLSMLRELMEWAALLKARQPAAGEAADPRRPAAERAADRCGVPATAGEVREADHQARPFAGRAWRSGRGCSSYLSVAWGLTKASATASLRICPCPPNWSAKPRPRSTAGLAVVRWVCCTLLGSIEAKACR